MITKIKALRDWLTLRNGEDVDPKAYQAFRLGYWRSLGTGSDCRSPWQKYLDLTAHNGKPIYVDGQWEIDWDSIPESFGKTLAMGCNKSLFGLPLIDSSQATDFTGMFKHCWVDLDAKSKTFREIRKECPALVSPPTID
jgi:hypothetical protein